MCEMRLHRNDINGGGGGDGSAVSLPRSIVGTWHCRLLACHSGYAGIDRMCAMRPLHYFHPSVKSVERIRCRTSSIPDYLFRAHIRYLQSAKHRRHYPLNRNHPP